MVQVQVQVTQDRPLSLNLAQEARPGRGGAHGLLYPSGPLPWGPLA